MTGQIHKLLVTIAQIVGPVGALILTADQVPFDLDARDVGLSLVWAGQIATIIATAIRGNWLPGVTTGVGNEQMWVVEGIAAWVLYLAVVSLLFAASVWLMTYIIDWFTDR